MFFQAFVDPFQCLVSPRKLSLHPDHGPGRSNACYYVFSLGINEILAIKLSFPGGRVSGEGNTCCTVITHIPIHHRLNVHGCSPVVRNTVDVSVDDRTLPHPGSEDCAYAAPELLHRVIRKASFRALFHDLLEGINQFLEVICCQLGVQMNPTLILDLLNGHLEGVMLYSFRLDAHHNVTISLDESPIGIIHESFVSRFLDQPSCDLVIESKV